MNIQKSINDNNMIIKLEGRLDTNTAPELEKEISSLDGIKSIVFDFENLEYISSSGLRLILKCKKAVDATKIINCSLDVYEIFSVTGFAEMMEIEKAMRKISIEGCEKLGEGFYGTIYRIDPETIVKVYKFVDSLDDINRERNLAKMAFVLGVPTAIPYDIVKVDDKYGAVFELLNAQSMVNLVNDEKELDNFTKSSANILKAMHQNEIKDGDLPSRKQTVIALLKECETAFSKEIFDKLNALLNSIPEKNTMLHCDFHVKNIMKQNDELLLIDMDTLSVGQPIFEFASMYATYEGYASVDKQNTEKFLGLPLETTKKIFDKTFRYYYDDKTEEELEDIKKKLSVISFIQILRNRMKYKDKGFGLEKEEAEFCIDYLTNIADKLDTLAY